MISAATLTLIFHFNFNSTSNIHYVGYVEDEESVEAIMKKFEELDRIQKEFSAISVNSTPNTSSENKENEIESNGTPAEMEEKKSEAAASQGLTEEQLQEIFKRTSAFTIRSAMMDSNDMDELNDVEIWQLQYHDGLTDEIYEEEYVYILPSRLFAIFMYADCIIFHQRLHTFRHGRRRLLGYGIWRRCKTEKASATSASTCSRKGSQWRQTWH